MAGITAHTEVSEPQDQDRPKPLPPIPELVGSNPPEEPPEESPEISPTGSPTRSRFLAVGIDFGTTYSGVSWAYSEDPENINVITSWPCEGEQRTDEQQVPTQYNLETGEWGYMIGKDNKPLRWFKLLLLDDKDIKADIRNCEALSDTRKQMNGADKNEVITLIGKYLGKVWNHALEEIKCQISGSDLDDIPFKVAITIPAIWPQNARNSMKEAAKRAGILDHRDIGETMLLLVEEPEAAALATLMERKKYPDIKVGESFVVCDCGGGTVDIISYKVTSMDPFQVEETVVGDGKLCGAFMIDDAFEKWMDIKSGLKFKNCHQGDFRRFVDEQWEFTLKRNFHGGEATDFSVRPPQRAFSRRKRYVGNADSYKIPCASIKQFYGRSLGGIKDLVSKQVKGVQSVSEKLPKTILLVGGLGSSKYIYNELNELYGNVLQPTRPWSAVARGATIKLLSHTIMNPDFVPSPRHIQLVDNMPCITTRISKLSYGIQAGVAVKLCDPPVDPHIDCIRTDPDGSIVVDRMRWYLKKGERVDNKDPVGMDFCEFITTAKMTKTTFDILTCKESPPPIRKDMLLLEGMCSIECEYDKPFKLLPKVENTCFRKVDNMKLTMRFDGEPKWALQIGNNKTEKDVKVEYTL